MTTGSRTVAVILLLAAALSACAGPSRAPRDLLRPDPNLQCLSERGMGGTGISGDERGMGGTGLMAAADRGMGGTGVTAGVVGTVTGFGSICVNGLRVVYDDTVSVQRDGLPVGLEALARGVTVAALVAHQNGQLQASSISVLHAMVGPVTAPASTGFAVMGVPIETAFTAGEASATFAVGDIVIVDGLQRADGAIDATRIVRAASDARVSVRGVVSAVAADSVRVGGVDIAIRIPDPEALLGRWIQASGVWMNNALRPDSVNVDLELNVPANTPLSLEGYLLPQPGGGFGIRGVPVRENQARALARDVIARLSAGPRVQVIGTTEADGGLRVQTIVVPDRRNPFQDDADPPADIVNDSETRTRAAAPTAAPTARENLQRERGVYGETITRPGVVRGTVPSSGESFPTRPLQDRPLQIPMPRPSVPTRPGGGRG